VTATGGRKWLQPSGVLVQSKVLVRIVQQGMKYATFPAVVVKIRIEISFELIALETSVYQIVVCVITALRHGVKMIDC
jgi:hypothetical protein